MINYINLFVKVDRQDNFIMTKLKKENFFFIVSIIFFSVFSPCLSLHGKKKQKKQIKKANVEENKLMISAKKKFKSIVNQVSSPIFLLVTLLILIKKISILFQENYIIDGCIKIKINNTRNNKYLWKPTGIPSLKKRNILPLLKEDLNSIGKNINKIEELYLAKYYIQTLYIGSFQNKENPAIMTLFSNLTGCRYKSEDFNHEHLKDNLVVLESWRKEYIKRIKNKV